MRSPLSAGVLCVFFVVACSSSEGVRRDSGGLDDAQRADAGVTGDSGARGDATSGNDTAGLGDAAAADDGAVATSQACADISAQIAASAGHTITVSPGAAGEVMVGSTTTTLRQVLLDASPGDTVLLADGTYTFHAAGTGHGDYTGLYLDTENVTLRSASGNARAVILDSNYVDHGGQSALVTIDASGVVLADLTLKRAVYHLVHFWSNADNVRVHNVRLEDGGQQFLKASGTDIADVTVSCSHFVMTDAGRANVWGYGDLDGGTRCYTGGIDTHDARHWHVHDNRFEDIYCDAEVGHPVHGLADATYYGGLAEHAIHMWDAPAGGGHIIERNQVFNCARGIGVGMASDVYDTVIRNNMVFSRHAGGSEHDVGINVERGHDIQIDNNTVMMSSPDAYDNAIEYRFASSNLSVRNNLTNRAIRARDGATATLSHNLQTAQGPWFVDGLQGDLHLAGCNLVAVVAQGEVLAGVTDDIDHQPRGATNDIGADQCGP